MIIDIALGIVLASVLLSLLSFAMYVFFLAVGFTYPGLTTSAKFRRFVKLVLFGAAAIG